jgi:signal transduction histidine kinase
MQERAELLGGNVDVRAEPGSGTRVTLRLPRSA